MKFYSLLMALLCLFLLLCYNKACAQGDENEKVEYYQMEPYDDSLFINIQTEIFIDPPDPKAEIIVDLRDKNNQTISIKGALYPFLAFKPETRAKIITYPFKLNLLDNINFASVFTHVLQKIKFAKVFEPPRYTQISSPLQYINPYLQVYGGERFGLPIKEDLGISIGFGTPYSSPRETNFAEANVHLLGFYAGAIYTIDALFDPSEAKNPFWASTGYQIGYVIPFGNFFEFTYQKSLRALSDEVLRSSMDGRKTPPKYFQGSYMNWEFRYPFRTLGSSKAKVYLAKYQNEWHTGFTGRELSLAGSTFDLRIDALFNTPDRTKQYLIDILVQKIAASWGFSAFAFGPSILIGYDEKGRLEFSSFFVNARLKVGTSF
ncbi:MAG: hypothetical protein Q8933_13970 [Bacteroidota bacterium]|nr:hypothetical protein [Bacteroidota bacterium]MDP4195086.1 hypothetical protein [Bacteroidota bacterium]